MISKFKNTLISLTLHGSVNPYFYIIMVAFTACQSISVVIDRHQPAWYIFFWTDFSNYLSSIAVVIIGSILVILLLGSFIVKFIHSSVIFYFVIVLPVLFYISSVTTTLIPHVNSQVNVVNVDLLYNIFRVILSVTSVFNPILVTVVGSIFSVFFKVGII